MTQIKHKRPPNFEAIAAVFPGAHNRGVIFAYAPYIYAPDHITLPPHIVAHEEVHIARQLKQGVENWWFHYLSSADFRWEEELLAHRAEWRRIIIGASRQVRRSSLKEVAKKLASPLYGKMVPHKQAMEAIAAEAA